MTYAEQVIKAERKLKKASAYSEVNRAVKLQKFLGVLFAGMKVDDRAEYNELTGRGATCLP